MYKDEETAERLWLHLSKGRADQMRAMAKDLNLSLTQFLAMVAWLGAKMIQEKIADGVSTGDSDKSS